MKRIITTTLMALLLCVFMVFGLTACGGLTQDDIDNAVNDATATLNEQITALEADISDKTAKIATLEGEKTTLTTEKGELEADIKELEAKATSIEAEKTALKAELAAIEAEAAALEAEVAALEAELAEKAIELACLKGEHVWDGESELEYIWSDGMTKCTVFFDCTHCGEDGSVESVSVTADEDGNIVAEFDGGFPSDIYPDPVVTGVAFNTDSEGYDEATNTFLVSDENSFVITFTGKNFDMLNEEKDFAVGLKLEGNWYFFDEIYTPEYDGVSITIEEDKITYIWDYDCMVWVLNGVAINQVDGFVLCDGDTLEMIVTSMVEVNLTVQKSDAPSDEWVTVTTADDLLAALIKGGNIRLGADIDVGEELASINRTTVLDLNGNILTTSFWSGIEIGVNVTATVKNGTVQNLSEGGIAITSRGNLTVENCVLKGKNRYALAVRDNRAEVKDSTLDGGVNVRNSYTEYAELCAVDNVTVIPGEFKIAVEYGTATLRI